MERNCAEMQLFGWKYDVSMEGLGRRDMQRWRRVGAAEEDIELASVVALGSTLEFASSRVCQDDVHSVWVKKYAERAT